MINYLIIKNLLFLSCFVFLGHACSTQNDLKLEKVVEKNSFKTADKGYSEGPSLQGKKETLFVDKTEEYGLSGVSGVHFYAPDLDNDGYFDLVILPDFYSIPRFFLFLPARKKFEELKYNPFNYVIRASFLHFNDFDKDGVIDLLLGTLNQKTELSKFPLRIYKGAYKKNDNSAIFFEEIEGSFENKTVPNSSIGVLDFDLDGKLDIFQGNWFDSSSRNLKLVGDRLLKGDGFLFKDESTRLTNEYEKVNKVYRNIRPTFGVATCDIDQNGFPDILTTSSSGFRNKLWLNRYHKEYKLRVFEDFGEISKFASDSVGDPAQKDGGNSFFSICGDYNNDGIMDIVLGELSHSYDAEEKDRSSILTGETTSFPPKFIRTEYYLDNGKEQWNQGDKNGQWIDYNIDGLVDIVIENSGFPPSSRLLLFSQEKDHAYGDVAKSLGIDIVNPSGTIVLDLNQDGLPDIITGQTKVRDSRIKPRVYIFENNYKRGKKKSIQFYLRGDKANILGEGAMVTLYTKKFKAKKWLNSSSGPLPSQRPEGVHFGLGENNTLEKVEVRWPIVKEGEEAKGGVIRTYKLKGLKFNHHINLTLCEGGKILKNSKKNCY